MNDPEIPPPSPSHGTCMSDCPSKGKRRDIKITLPSNESRSRREDPATGSSSSSQRRRRPRLELGHMKPSLGFMSTGLAEEEDGSSMDQILQAGRSMFDATADHTAPRRHSTGVVMHRTMYDHHVSGSEEERREDSDQGDDPFKISRSGTFEYGNIIKIGYDGIRKSANAGLLSSGHSRIPSEHLSTSPSSGSSTLTSCDVGSENSDALSTSSKKCLGAADEGGENVPLDTISTRGKIAFEDLIVKGKLGSGASANVKKVVHRVTGKEYAMKAIALDTRNEMNPKVILTEYSVMFENDCEQVVDLFESFYRNGNIYMIIEYMNCGSLRDIIDTCGAIPEYALSKIAFEILKGLQFIHRKKVIHRDIKPENILANHLGQVKIADFGMAGFRNDSVSFETFQGTYTYMSPERLSTDKHSFSSDIWSVGLTILECAMGCFPLQLADVNFWNMVEVVQNIRQRINIPDSLSSDLCQFVFDCLTVEASERPSAAQLLEYDFITRYQHTKPSLRRWINEEFVAKKKRQRQERERDKCRPNR